MVKPSSGITSLGGDLQSLDDDKELVKNQLSLEDIDSIANVDEVGSSEKLYLNRSSGDESIKRMLWRLSKLSPMLNLMFSEERLSLIPRNM
jgi:apoptotic chromatin condensation inducer in the nucleus